jgi:hypothetical protein
MQVSEFRVHPQIQQEAPNDAVAGARSQKSGSLIRWSELALAPADLGSHTSRGVRRPLQVQLGRWLSLDWSERIAGLWFAAIRSAY